MTSSFKFGLSFTLGFFGVGIATLATLSWLTWSLYYRRHRYRRRHRPQPTNWIRIGTLKQINIFPTKSCGPLILLDRNDVIECNDLGLEFNGIADRRLMLINEQNEMITARTYPHMILIKSELIGNGRIRYTTPDGIDPLIIDLQEIHRESNECNESKLFQTSVWDSKVKVYPCGKEYDKWFSKFILKKESGLRLVYFPHLKPIREITEQLSTEEHLRKYDVVMFLLLFLHSTMECKILPSTLK